MVEKNNRCPWARNELEIIYHDQEWGRPEHDDAKLFEMLILEGLQAGLSWSAILKKREGLRVILDGFDPYKISAYGPEKEAELMEDPRMLRNRLKVAALSRNARAFLGVADEFGSFDRYLWGFVNGRPVTNKRRKMEDVPAKNEISERLSRDLKKRGFKFTGPVICYAYMQAVGLVNDHLVSCQHHKLCRDE